MRWQSLWALGAALCALTIVAPPRAPASFVTFESGQVRPLALSPDGTRLFAVNTPDNQLEIFSVAGGALAHVGAVPVGLEPVAVAARDERRGLGRQPSLRQRQHRRRRGDAAARRRARCSSATSRATSSSPARAAPAPSSPRRTAGRTCRSIRSSPPPGVGRADVWVFDAANLGAALGGTPLTIVTLFGDTPRALAVSADGNTVYAAVFHSGNRTTTVHEGAVCDGGAGAGSCTVDGVHDAGRPAGAEHQRRARPAARGRADRPLRRRRAGATSSAATGTTRCASRCPTATCSRSTPRPTRRSRRQRRAASARSSSTWPSTR